MTYGLIFPPVFGTYKELSKKKKVRGKGYQLSDTGKGKKIYSDEMIGHIKWLAERRQFREVADLFPQVSQGSLRRIFEGDARFRVRPSRVPGLPE